jgi:hypothetical protein
MQGLTPTLANRQPIGVGDDASFNSLTLSGQTASTGAIIRGNKVNVISGVGATRTLLAQESGATCLFDAATGVIYTLPAPVVGLYFDFVCTVTITSGSARVNTDVGTTFLLGAVNLIIAASATTLAAQGNGTSNTIISSNGTTTGGVKGGAYRLTCVSSTVWNVEGFVNASGALATPFA